MIETTELKRNNLVSGYFKNGKRDAAGMIQKSSSAVQLTGVLAALLLALAPGSLAATVADAPIVLGADTQAYLDQAVADGLLDQDLVDDIRAIAAAPDAKLHKDVFARYLEALGAQPVLESNEVWSCEDSCRGQFDACYAQCKAQFEACMAAGGDSDICHALRQRCVDACENQYRACRRLCDAPVVRELVDLRTLVVA